MPSDTAKVFSFCLLNVFLFGGLFFFVCFFYILGSRGSLFCGCLFCNCFGFRAFLYGSFSAFLGSFYCFFGSFYCFFNRLDSLFDGCLIGCNYLLLGKLLFLESRDFIFVLGFYFFGLVYVLFDNFFLENFCFFGNIFSFFNPFPMGKVRFCLILKDFCITKTTYFLPIFPLKKSCFS